MKLVGNGRKATWLIGVFISILIYLCWASFAKASPQIYVSPGVSFGPGGSGPTLGLDLVFREDKDFSFFTGTTMWGSTSRMETNWSWETGFTACRGNFCAQLGASFVQRIDGVIGSHQNFYLGLVWKFGNNPRLDHIEITHRSNAGTADVNQGLNNLQFPVRLR